MKSILCSFLVLFVLIISGCRKDVPAGKAQYIGTWLGEYEEIVINSDGSAGYYYNDGILTKSLEGKSRFTDNEIIIKAAIFKKEFKINTQPTEMSTPGYYGGSVTYMKLNGKDYYRL